MGDSNKKKVNSALARFGGHSQDLRDNILVASYDQMRINIKRLAAIKTIGSQVVLELHSSNSGLVICDEGHRLKNAAIKTSVALNSIPTAKRVILSGTFYSKGTAKRGRRRVRWRTGSVFSVTYPSSGTPIQNNLKEFHAMVSFVNPNVLQDINTFSRLYEEPIEAMRQPDATNEERVFILRHQPPSAPSLSSTPPCRLTSPSLTLSWSLPAFSAYSFLLT
jgi:SNF2 family DNA or RNA helicase